MSIKQLFFAILLITLIGSLGWKLNDSSGRLGADWPAICMVGIIFIILLLGIRKVLRY